jgi:hypothetical protein
MKGLEGETSVAASPYRLPDAAQQQLQSSLPQQQQQLPSSAPARMPLQPLGPAMAQGPAAAGAAVLPGVANPVLVGSPHLLSGSTQSCAPEPCATSAHMR